jgi:hypothetical protein
MTKQDNATHKRVSRREFASSAAGAGAMLALAPHLAPAAVQYQTERRTLFFNFSHEDHQRHTYYVVMGKHRHRLNPVTAAHPALAAARRNNRFLAALPDSEITHVVEDVPLSGTTAQLLYTMRDPQTSSGTWGMSSIYLVPPKSSLAKAHRAIRKGLNFGAALPLSAKRQSYGLTPAVSLQDFLDEQDLLDTNDWATAMVNLHPEMLSADPDSAALIQTKYINVLPNTNLLARVLSAAKTAMPQQSPGMDNPSGWATLVPYTDDDGVSPLKSTSGLTNGLILYKAQWQPGISNPFVSAAMKPALQSVKNDSTLGADVTGGSASLSASDVRGALWYRKDGVASVDQSPGTQANAESSDNAKYTLTNITPSYNGYSLSASVSDATVTLNFQNWYLRWLGLYAQFYKSDGTVLPTSEVPGVSQDPSLDKGSSFCFLGILTPELTIYGIPVKQSTTTVSFPFPAAASSASILAGGLGYGSHTFQETELVGTIFTSVFQLCIPAFMMAIGVAGAFDAMYRIVILPSLNLLITELATAGEGETTAQFLAILWRSIVKGLANPAGPLKLFLTLFGEFLAWAEATTAFIDSIPLIDAIFQAAAALAVEADIAETSIETGLSPWTYAFSLVGTHDLSLTILPGNPAFPAAAATYTVKAIFDNGTPYVQTLTMPGAGVSQLPPVVFKNVPLGGKVTLSAGFYAADGTQVGHGATVPLPNETGNNPTLTITQDRLPLNASTIYMHKQKTALDAQSNHLWGCGPAPAAPSVPSACGTSVGNLCDFRNITFSSSMGYVGYGWQSYSTAACESGTSGQLDQMANIAIANGAGGNAQGAYGTVPCALGGAANLVYDPLGRSAVNYYVDTTDSANVLRQVQLSPLQFSDPRAHQAWGKFNLPPDDVLLHPAGTIITINTALSRMESLLLPIAPVSDAAAGVSLLANLHGGLGSRPGLFSSPSAATITAEGVVLILEGGNNRIHAVDAFANPVRHFSGQAEPYFLNLSETGGGGTEYLDIAVEFSGFIYVLSSSNSVYRLDIYSADQKGSSPVCTTMGFNAAKVTVDYWRNVYSLNYEVLKANGALPANGVTEPSISQWIPTTPPACDANVLATAQTRMARNQRLLRRRDLWRRMGPEA